MRLTEFVFERFYLPVLPGDGAVVEEFVLRVWKAISNTISSIQDVPDPSKPTPTFEHVEIISRVLFLLVVVRVYLGCRPLHDAEVYDLCRRLTPAELAETPASAVALRGKIDEHLSPHEKAYYSSQPIAPETDEKGRASTAKLPLNDLRGHRETRVQHRGIHLSLQIDPTLPPLDRHSRLSATTESGQPYTFHLDPSSNIPALQRLSLSSSANTGQPGQSFRIIQGNASLKPPTRTLRKRNPAVSYFGTDSGNRGSRKRQRK